MQYLSTEEKINNKLKDLCKEYSEIMRKIKDLEIEKLLSRKLELERETKDLFEALKTLDRGGIVLGI